MLISVQIKPNWLPAYSPAWIDISNRLFGNNGGTISRGIQRKEDPFIITYDDVTFSFFNPDLFFDDIFNLNKIMGTDLANLNAPLLNVGSIKLATRETSAQNWRVLFFGRINQTDVNLDQTAQLCTITVYGVGKDMEIGNAERVHRFSSIVAPRPYVLSGYDLTHPASPPGVFALTADGSGTPPLVAADPATKIIHGSHTLFTRDLRQGNTITINGVSATILSIEDDGHLTLTDFWGGVDTSGLFTAFMWHSGQSDSCFRLSRFDGSRPLANTLSFFPGDKFKAIAKVAVADYVEGMQTADMGGNEFVVSGAVALGDDLLIFTVDPVPGLALVAGQASLEVVTPWYHGKRYTELMRALIVETNAAKAQAGDMNTLVLAPLPPAPLLGLPFADLVDELGFVFPASGAGWYLKGAARAIAVASGHQGISKADFLQDAVVSERTFGTDQFQTAPTIGSGATIATFFSPTYGLPFTYADPSPTLSGAIPPPDIAKAPAIGQDLLSLSGVTQVKTGFISNQKIHCRWLLSIGSFASAAAAVKYAYRLESVDVCAEIPGSQIKGVWQNKAGYTLGLYLTSGTVPNEVWAVGSSGNAPVTVIEVKGVPASGPNPAGISTDEVSPQTDPFAQGQVAVFPVSGGFLYLLTDGGKRQAYFYKGTVDNDTPANITQHAGRVDFANQFAWNTGARSGALADGTNVFYFEDAGASESQGIGVIAGTPSTSATWTLTGASTQFIRDLRAGDVILAYNLASPNPNRFIVHTTAASATSVTMEKTATTGTFSSQNYHIVKFQSALKLWYWNGTAMAAATIGAGFPTIPGADWAHAVIDAGRQHILVVCQGILYRIAYTFSGSTLTVVSVVTAELDSVNYDQNIASDHVGPLAWITGPVDALQGISGEQIDYDAAGDAMLIVTTQGVYIFSDVYAGIIQIADFTGMSCSTAAGLMLQISQQVMTSGADQQTVPDMDAYDPVPTVFVEPRISQT